MLKIVAITPFFYSHNFIYYTFHLIDYSQKTFYYSQLIYASLPTKKRVNVINVHYIVT